MDKNLHDIENLFRTALEDNEESPSQNSWDGIEKRLDKDNIVSIKKKYNLLKKVAFLLMVLLAGLSMYVLMNHDKNSVEPSNNFSEINKESKARVDSLKQESVTINLQKHVDSLTINSVKKSKPLSESSNENFDKVIVRSEEKDSKKPLNVVTTKDILNSKINYTKSNETLLPAASKFTIKKKNKSNEINSNDVVASSGIQFENNLSASDTLSLIVFGNTKINKSQIIIGRERLPNMVLSEINPLMQIEKRIIQKPLKSVQQSRFAVTVFYSPDITFYHYENNDHANSRNHDFKKSESESYSFTLGSLIEYTNGKHWGLQSGVTLTTSNFELESKIIYAQRDNSGGIKYKLATSLGDAFVKPSFSNNPHVGDSILSTSTFRTLQYLGIPLSLKYNLYKGKFTLNALGGVSANFLTRGRITTELKSGNEKERETTDKVHGLKQFYFSGLAGVGVDYNFYKKLSLSFSPTLRFALNAMNSNVSVNSFPNSVGFLTGLKVKL
ncbi:MAG: outer membrane beta-barrel protein [Ginsengibacter sp.]